MRFLALLICLLFIFGCGRPGSKRNEEERAVQEELRTSEPESSEHKDPDGAFGAKDYADEARDASDQNTEQLKSAIEETDDE